jgi:hypothetical protein
LKIHAGYRRCRRLLKRLSRTAGSTSIAAASIIKADWLLYFEEHYGPDYLLHYRCFTEFKNGFFVSLQGLSLLDTEAQSDGPPTWSRRHRKLIRGLLIVCLTPVCAVLCFLLVGWAMSLGPVAQKIVMGVVGMQVIGLVVLLSRRRGTEA